MASLDSVSSRDSAALPARAPRSRDELSADPFGELGVPSIARRIGVLGGEFEFETECPELAQLVEWAYAGLPAHRLGRRAPRFRLRLSLAPTATAGIPRIVTLCGAGLLCGATAASTFAAISPGEHAAHIVVARGMMRHPYHVRYELIELAVFTLAARAQGLVPLHAACLGAADRGLLVMGESGAGKSTAALHGALRGLELVSEDSTFVAPDSLLATGVANFLHVRRSSLEFLPRALAARMRQFPSIRRRSGVVKLEIDPRRGPFALAPRPVALRAIVFASAHRSGAPLLVDLPAQEVARRLEAMQPYAAGRPEWPTFMRRIRALPAFELRRGRHPADGAAALASLLEVAASGSAGAG
jgi:hypothetical protein